MVQRRIRMAELARESGVSRETIHYYMREGLLPRPLKAGRTLSFYDDSHVERLRLIRRLREDKYLPLAVIRRMLDAGIERPHAADLDALADVLAIDPSVGAHEDGIAVVVDGEATRTAKELGLLDARASASPDPTEARVLGAVAEALALDATARELTLGDMRACAGELTRLVEREAALFFELAFSTGDVTRSVRALRAGRGAVARFITAYRDLMLRRIVEEILGTLAAGPRAFDTPPLLPLGATTLARLEVASRRAVLWQRALAGDAAAANDLAWLLFSVGAPGELASVPEAVQALLRPRAALLLATAAGADVLRVERALDRAGPFALGEVLLAEARLAAAVRRPDDGGVLERIVPALAGLVAARPGTDADPLASASAFYRRGRIGIVLPRVTGWRRHAAQDLALALEVLLSAPGRVEPAAVARLEGNCRLLLGRLHAEAGEAAPARAELERAWAVDPDGPIGEAASVGLRSTNLAVSGRR